MPLGGFKNKRGFEAYEPSYLIMTKCLQIMEQEFGKQTEKLYHEMLTSG